MDELNEVHITVAVVFSSAEKWDNFYWVEKKIRSIDIQCTIRDVISLIGDWKKSADGSIQLFSIVQIQLIANSFRSHTIKLTSSSRF